MAASLHGNLVNLVRQHRLVGTSCKSPVAASSITAFSHSQGSHYYHYYHSIPPPHTTAVHYCCALLHCTVTHTTSQLTTHRTCTNRTNSIFLPAPSLRPHSSLLSFSRLPLKLSPSTPSDTPSHHTFCTRNLALIAYISPAFFRCTLVVSAPRRVSPSHISPSISLRRLLYSRAQGNDWQSSAIRVYSHMQKVYILHCCLPWIALFALFCTHVKKDL